MVKQLTPWEIAKPILEKLYLDGEITDDMARGSVWRLRQEFMACNINNFGNNWNRMKKSIGGLKKRANDDMIALAHDRILHPINMNNRWDGSAAQKLLKSDVKDDFHLHFTPLELWTSRAEYKAFPLHVFRPHVHQEVRSKVETNYWLVKKAKKEAKKRARLMATTDNVEFNGAEE